MSRTPLLRLLRLRFFDRRLKTILIAVRLLPCRYIDDRFSELVGVTRAFGVLVGHTGHIALSQLVLKRTNRFYRATIKLTHYPSGGSGSV
jgi:hypothetical protein